MNSLINMSDFLQQKPSPASVHTAIGSHNIGHSLLMKMGWKGSGGVGKREDGIAEPVLVNTVKGRQGLGHEDAISAISETKWKNDEYNHASHSSGKSSSSKSTPSRETSTS